jgi:hypothetical protein
MEAPMPEATTTNAMDTENTYNDYEPIEDEIADDMDFLEHTKRARKIMDIGDIDEIKPQQAELLRIELSKIIKYVMDKVQAEREAEQAFAREQEREPEQQEPEREPVQGQGQGQGQMESQLPMPNTATGGDYKKKSKAKGATKRIKGGNTQTVPGGSSISMNSDRILNTDGLINANHDPRKMDGSSEVVNANSVHRAFSAGSTFGNSSTGGLPESEIKTMVPYYGTGGKIQTKSRKNKKSQKK